MAIRKIIKRATDSLFVNTEFDGTEAARMPVGTTAQREGSPKVGDLRHNTTIDILEQYTSTGWQGIASPPVVTSISPTDINESDSTQTIVITGSNFDSSATGSLKNSSSATVSPTTSTRNSSSQITIVFSGGDTISTDAGPYDAVVTNGSGLSATLEDALTLDNTPAWSTAAGTLATGYEKTEDTRKVWNGNYSGFTLTSSGNYSGKTPASMFGGLFGGDDGWAGPLNTDDWWQIDMGYSVVLSKFTYYNNDGFGNKVTHKLQGSNDNSTFVDIYNLGQYANYTKVDTSPGSTAYRYWRIRRTWSSNNYGRMGGLEIEYTPHADDSLLNGSDVSVTLSATDPEGSSVTYAVTSGALPTGVALSGATVSGILNGGNGDYNASGVTHNATVTASDGTGNTTPRTFNIVRKWYDGSSSANAALNAESIRNMTGATSSDDGTYWINPYGRSTIQLPCEFNSMGGWMLFATGDGSGAPVSTGSAASGTVALGSKGKINDADMNAIDWNHCWHGMTVNDTDSSGFLMDPNRQVFSVQNNDGGTSHGLQFTIIWQRNYDQWTGGNTGNGRNIQWSYKGIAGSGGASLTGSTRQNGTVINSTGSTDYAMANSNTYGVSPHEGGGGGAWMHSANGDNGNFNTGFGSDSNNQAYTTRYTYWFFK